MVKFPNPTVEGDGNIINAGVVGSKPLSSTRKSAEAAVVFRFKMLRFVETERSRSRVNQAARMFRIHLPSEGRGHRFESCRARQQFQEVK